MIITALASKKNYIILALVVLLISLTGISYFRKQDKINKKIMLGGEIELVIQNVILPKHEWRFMRDHSAKISHVADLKTNLPMPDGSLFEANVRAWDRDPLFGTIDLDKKHFKICYIEDWKTKTFGVAVNQKFLDHTGMKFADAFKMGNNTYQIRAIIKSMPDKAGQKLMEAPFLMVKHVPMRGSGMFEKARARELRYLAISRNLSAKSWEEKFKKIFPKSPALLNRWDNLDYIDKDNVAIKN